MRGSLRLVLAWVALSAVGVEDAYACLAIGDGSVRVRGEEALIVFDENTHREYFVRTADFRARSSFAFLVPVPSEPTLSAAPRRLFVDLYEIYREHPEWNQRRAWGALGDAGPEYVREQRVGGLDTAVLRGSDANGMQTWLSAHGYRLPENAADWIADYARAGYYFVAARYVARAGSARISPLVIAFDTSRPFFPYSEITSSAGRGRRFRVSVVTQHRVDGYLSALARAHNDTPEHRPWVAPAYARRAPRLSQIIRPIVGAGNTVPPWITTFDLRASARDGSDLFFEPHATDTPVASHIHERMISETHPAPLFGVSYTSVSHASMTSH